MKTVADKRMWETQREIYFQWIKTTKHTLLNHNNMAFFIKINFASNAILTFSTVQSLSNA